MKQRSKEWFEARMGRFTASEIWKLFKKDRSGKGWGQTARTYIEQKAIERVTMFIPDTFTSYQTNHGIHYEDEARDMFFLLTGLVVKSSGFNTYKEYAGGSPDGYIDEHTLFEVKCPVDARVHMIDNLQYPPSLDHKSEYWIQMQANMLFTYAMQTWYVSYNPHLEVKHCMWKWLIKRDEAFCYAIRQRLKEADAQCNEIVGQLKKTLTIKRSTANM